MKGLLKKDFIFLKQQKKYILLIFIITAIVAYGNPQSAFISSYLTFLGSGLIINSLAYDAYQHGLTYLFALPFTKKDYVKEKYIYALIMISVFWFIGNLISIVFNQFSLNNLSFEFNLIILMIALCYLAIIMPIHIKYGREKASTIIIVIALLIALITTQFIDIKNISFPVSILVIGMLLITVLFYFLSYRLSISTLEKKEF